MTHLRRAPGTIAGWVCLLATLLHALAFTVHAGRAASSAPAGFTAALSGALCAGSESFEAHLSIGGEDEERPGLPASGCPICTAGAAIVALPAPAGPELATRPTCAARAGPMWAQRHERGATRAATPIRGPPAARVIV